MGAVPRGKGFDNLTEQSRRQEAIIVTVSAADLPDIIAGPFELVALANNDPGTLVIESEMALDRGGNLNRASAIGRTSMCDRKDDDNRGVIRGTLDGQDDYARTIFATFVPPRLVLVVPQIGIGYDEARSGAGIGTRPRYFGSSSESRCACRSSMCEEPIAWARSSERSAVAKLRRRCLKRRNSSYSSGATK